VFAWKHARIWAKTHTEADGTKVFPGMIAAPSNYAFGTKICLKGLGCGAVHDRGGAIVKKGERNLAKHDRLDIWMGYGEAGLLRALNFNFKHLNGTVYSPDSNIASTIYFKDSMSLAQILEGLPERIEFRKNLSLGSNGNEVKKLQKYLVKLGLFKGSVNGIYDKKTVQAVLHFQQKYFVLKNSKQVGAGVFGPKTRNILTDILYKVEMQKLMQEKWNETHFEKSLNKGKRSADVYKLQEILIKEELLEHVPTGYFGSLTKQALIAWQIKKGIVRNKYQNGAGLVGPKTRDFLNDYVQNQRESIKKEHGKILVFEKRNQKLNYLAGKNLNLNFVVR
jgi:peptidoglycan hydrolase-like protein with peptidoglycan-binding domain